MTVHDPGDDHQPPIVGQPGARANRRLVTNPAPGRKLAAGRDADVFELGAGRVLRRNRRGTSQELEAAVLRYAWERRFPVPAVYGCDGPNLVMERVDGPTMLDDLAHRPWMVLRHAGALARLHRRLHTIPAPTWLPPFPPDAATDAPTLPAASAPPAEAVLLHLDLHPANVILSPRGPVVIDWTNAKRGPGAADEAQTWVVMATSEIPGSVLERQAFDLLRRAFVWGLLRHLDRPALLAHLPTVAALRMADRNVTAREQAAIRVLLDRASRTGR